MILLRLGFDSRCALMSPPIDPVGQLIPLPTGALLCVPLSGPSMALPHPSGLISVKPVWISHCVGGPVQAPWSVRSGSAVWAMSMGDRVRQLEAPNAAGERRGRRLSHQLGV